MSKYPRVWAHWADGIGFNGAICCTTREAAEACMIDGDTTVELIPLPEHEAVVAAAVAAERERLTSIIRSINPCDIEDSRPTFAGSTLRYVLDKIREVPK